MRPRANKPKELTGRTVLFCLLGFFGVIFAVNGVLVKAATSTFGGTEKMSSYAAGLTFSKEIAAAERQQALNWQVDGKLARGRDGAATFDVAVRDAQGVAVGGLTAEARLAHPANARLDQVIALSRTGPGSFHGETEGARGHWELFVDFYRDGARVYRSRSRVMLQ